MVRFDDDLKGTLSRSDFAKALRELKVKEGRKRSTTAHDDKNHHHTASLSVAAAG